MSEQPMFYQGQRVVANTNLPNSGWYFNPKYPKPVDGKSYYVQNPNSHAEDGLIFIRINGFDGYEMWQGLFIAYDADCALEEEIHEALRESLKINNPR